ncbi:hypothetical protein VNO80_09005 [Phaseolus coccineus]|uniref:Uncharacterized protein n=1 Tax=Phaseolus coccineus TaxID=3886 RepID=A0AAN9N5I4_PHACN
MKEEGKAVKWTLVAHACMKEQQNGARLPLCSDCRTNYRSAGSVQAILSTLCISFQKHPKMALPWLVLHKTLTENTLKGTDSAAPSAFTKKQQLLVQKQRKQNQHMLVLPLAYISSDLKSSASIGT